MRMSPRRRRDSKPGAPQLRIAVSASPELFGAKECHVASSVQGADTRELDTIGFLAMRTLCALNRSIGQLPTMARVVGHLHGTIRTSAREGLQVRLCRTSGG